MISEYVACCTTRNHRPVRGKLWIPLGNMQLLMLCGNTSCFDRRVIFLQYTPPLSLIVVLNNKCALHITSRQNKEKNGKFWLTRNQWNYSYIRLLLTVQLSRNYSWQNSIISCDVLKTFDVLLVLWGARNRYICHGGRLFKGLFM